MRTKSCNIRKYFLYHAGTNSSICLCSVSSTSLRKPTISDSKYSDLDLPYNNPGNDGAEQDQPYEPQSTISTAQSTFNSDTNNNQQSRKRKPSESSIIWDKQGKVKLVSALENSEEKELNTSHTVLFKNRCNFEIKGNKASNLKTHIKTKHSEVYEKYLQEENDLAQENKRNISQNQSATIPLDSSSASTFGKISFPRRESATVTVSVRPKDVLDGIIEMVTVNGRSFSQVNDSGLIRAFGGVMKACGLILNSQNIKDYIEEKSVEVQNLIRSYSNRLISLKVDCVSVTRLDRSFIGINMQIVDGGVIKIFNLSINEITSGHIGEDLKKIIFDTLAKYNLSKKNIYAITTDNGSNSPKANDLLPNEENTDPSIVQEDFDLLELLNETDFDASENENELFVNSIQQLDWYSLNVIPTKCATHIIQLCIIDSFKLTVKKEELKTYNDVIKKARNVIKELRTQTYMTLILEKNLPKPIIDCVSRWSSTRRMLGSLLALRRFCDPWGLMDDKLYLAEEDWEIIYELYVTLEPSMKAMSKLQSETITLTDCHKIWDLCHIKTAEIGTPFSQILVDSFSQRRAKMFENDVFLASIYLDPRFQFELSSEQKDRAVKHILEIHKKIQVLDIQDDIANINLPAGDSNSVDIDNDDIQYERLLKQKHLEKLHEEKILQINVSSEFETIARTFSPTRLKSNESVLKFWEDHQYIYKELYPIALVLFSVPCTQVSVERLFSQLRLILDPLRNCLPESIIHDILIVKSNFQHLVE